MRCLPIALTVKHFVALPWLKIKAKVFYLDYKCPQKMMCHGSWHWGHSNLFDSTWVSDILVRRAQGCDRKWRNVSGLNYRNLNWTLCQNPTQFQVSQNLMIKWNHRNSCTYFYIFYQLIQRGIHSSSLPPLFALSSVCFVSPKFSLDFLSC